MGCTSTSTPDATIATIAAVTTIATLATLATHTDTSVTAVTTSAWLSWRLFGSVHALVSNSSRSIQSLYHRMYRPLFPRVGGVNVITSPSQLCEARLSFPSR